MTSLHGEGVGYIVSLDVHPDVRRQAIGRTLLGMGEEELIRRGIGEILLHVAVDNEAGLRLYRREGYSVRSKVSCYYGWGRDAFLISKAVGETVEGEE